MNMNSSVRMLGILPWKPIGLTFLLLAGLCGCLYPGVGVGGAVVVGGDYDGNYFEPGGYQHGGWGSDYRVGPSRGGERGQERAGRPYRSAPAARRMPSIPSRGRAPR